MIVREFKKEDYNEVAKWWRAQGWPALPLEILSSAGFIAEEGDVKIAATWVFATNCPIYIMEWTVGNPEVEWELRNKGINLVTNKACDWAKADGAAQIFTMTKSKRFIDKLEESGFQVSDTEMTHLVRSL